ncbi:SBBP repeat-containing protein [Baia soyae]|uniref:Putative repeat protein (TIGR01451 family) n=1 Tax=Baia soyae TaxID=1544746 RepID=A0A4R2RXV1_9BACL|nr:SBBP repeat-containing protein [Baia soyae]TCP69384.1 putative repeat protein (TIGR01451 family) [Baia soyae]
MVVANPRRVETYGKLPLYFIPNQGQVDSHALFYGAHKGFRYSFTPEGVCLSWIETGKRDSIEEERRGYALALRFLDANHEAKLYARGLEEGKVNYFIGNDPREWITDLPTYREVVYEKVWGQIDAVFHGDSDQFKYDFLVHPGGDVSQVQWIYEGADDLTTDEEGNLHIHTCYGTIMEKKPYSYQEIEGKRREVESRFILSTNDAGQKVIGLHIEKYNPRVRLVIDPTLAYSTYLGGSGNDQGQGIAVDDVGNAYVVGFTDSTNYPITPGVLQSANAGGQDLFITKLNSSGSSLIYSTYLGGSGNDTLDNNSHPIAIDAAGNVYVTGTTASTDFPVTAGAFQPAYGGGASDAFVAKINALGSGLIYSTYLGGSGADVGTSIDVDSGNAYVTGYTTSTDFPTAGAFQPANAGGQDAFVTKLNASGSGLVYSTYLGGSASDIANEIVVDGAGNAYITGGTNSPNFPTTAGVFQPTLGGDQDVFVTKLNPSGNNLVFSTYLGVANHNEIGNGIAIDGDRNVYVTGLTRSPDFPVTLGGFQTTVPPGTVLSAFVSKFNSSGSTLIYSTFLGTSPTIGYSVKVNRAGNAIICGNTGQSDFPVTPDAFQSTLAGGRDGFVTAFTPNGSNLVYSTYLGGSGGDNLSDLALDVAGNIYVAGKTASTNFPVTSGVVQPNYAGGVNDAVVAKFTVVSILSITKSEEAHQVVTGGRITYTITVKNNGPDHNLAAVLRDSIPEHTTFIRFKQDDGPPAKISTPREGKRGVVTAIWNNFPVGETARFTLDVRIDARTPHNTVVTNTATISTQGLEEGASASTTVHATPANISIQESVTKPFPRRARVGQIISGTFTVTNEGPLDAPHVKFHIQVPPHVRILSTHVTKGASIETADVKRVNLGNIPVGESRSVRVRLIPQRVGPMRVKTDVTSPLDPFVEKVSVLIRVFPSLK